MNTGNNGNRQVSGGEVFSTINRSPVLLAGLAALLVLISLVIPFLGARTNLGMGVDQSGSLSGAQAAGWTGWVTLILFVAAAAARKVGELAPYRSLIDIAALVMCLVTLVWAWFKNPISEGLAQMTQALGRTGGPSPVSIYPHIGMIVLLVAAGLLVLARIRGKSATV